ncbi:MAG: hypothetical protein IJQ88_05180 [Clostridia bacterium]|nr:hypothetical protein [Clostridia bacterium]MBQ9401506.1 hypothetical protein [Clostridia bacterium]
MAWEFEDLFNNVRVDDGGFLAEPCFVPVGQMGYRRRTTVSGPRIDAEVFPVFGHGVKTMLRKARTGNGTPDAQKKANRDRSILRAIQIVEANFGERDVALALTYNGEPPAQDRVDKDLRNFTDRVKRRRKNLGLPELKYWAVIGGDEMPAAGYSGKRPHIHIFMNGGISRDELELMWGKGFANVDRLQPGSEGLAAIATYFAKQIQDRKETKGARRWRASKNLVKPVQRSRDAKMPNSRVRRIAYDFKNEAKAVMEKLYPGYVMTEEPVVRYSDYTPGVYIRCVLRKTRGGARDDGR